MNYEGISITSAAHVAPDRTVSNQELMGWLDTSDEWITRRTGIEQRHVATTETTTSLSTEVAERLLEKAGIKPEDLSAIIVATMSPDYLTPAVSATVQGNIHATNAFAFDINTACAGFVYALATAKRFLMNDESQYVMVIGAEVLSKIINWEDRTTAVLFGDGAGGVLLKNEENPSSDILAEDLRAYGSRGSALTANEIGQNTRFMDVEWEHYPFFRMDGHRVYQFAVSEVPRSIERALDKAGLALEDVDHFLLHQANQRIIRRIAKGLHVPIDKFPMNIQQYGNTAAASEPILLSECLEKGIVKRGETVVLSGFGGGLSIGTVVITI